VSWSSGCQAQEKESIMLYMDIKYALNTVNHSLSEPSFVSYRFVIYLLLIKLS
jgi:hypothetical protein